MLSKGEVQYDPNVAEFMDASFEILQVFREIFDEPESFINTNHDTIDFDVGNGYLYYDIEYYDGKSYIRTDKMHFRTKYDADSYVCTFKHFDLIQVKENKEKLIQTIKIWGGE